MQDDTFNFIAESISSSVRALEGSLIRILAYASYNKLNPEDIDTDMAQSILSDMITENRKEITLDNITQEVSKLWGITPTMIMEKTRRNVVAFPRQVAMYLANLLIPQLSLKDIALYFNRKDHTTVIHAKRMIENQFRDDKGLRAQIELIIKSVRK